VLLTFPFTVCCHFVRIGIDKIYTNKQPSEETDVEESEPEVLHKLRLTILSVCGIVIFVIGVVLAIGGAVFNALFHPYHMEHLDYIEPTWEYVTDEAAAVQCSVDILGWRLIELAGAAVMLDLLPNEMYRSWANPSSTNALGLATAGFDQDFAVQYGIDDRINSSEAFFQSFSRFSHYPVRPNDPDWNEQMDQFDGRAYVLEYGNYTVFGVEVGCWVGAGTEAQSIVTFNGIQSGEDFGVSIEIVWTYWFTELMRSIIPYYSFINNIFLQSFWNSLADQIVTLFFGPNRLSWNFAARYQAMAALRVAWDNFWAFVDWGEGGYLSNHNMVYVGHGFSGVLAKGLAILYRQYGVAFESGQFARSSPATTFDIQSPDGESLINFFSGTSILGMEEDITKSNLRFPDVLSVWKPASVYTTFCLIAAGCVMDDSFDHICREAIGFEEYQRYFRAWNRTRFDDPNG
jgi:hypothetical protein